MIVTGTYSSIDSSEWSRLADSSSTRSFFQTEECYGFYESLPFMEPFMFYVKEGEALKGVIVGYIQQEKGKVRQWITRRAIVPGGPMVDDDISEDALAELLYACIEGLRHKSIYVEFRNFFDYSKYRDVFRRCGFSYLPHLNFHIDTSSEGVMLANLGKSRKRDIRTSFRDGASIVESPSLDDVKTFYDILRELYLTKVKTPLFPFEFFERLYTSGIGIFRLVRFRDEIVGGTLCVGMKGAALYEWFACGRDGIYKNIFPSTVATFSGMEYGVRQGYPVFDMMGAGKPDEGYGVRDFKAKFGGVLVEHGRFLYVCEPLLYKIGTFGVKVLKKL